MKTPSGRDGVRPDLLRLAGHAERPRGHEVAQGLRRQVQLGAIHRLHTQEPGQELGVPLRQDLPTRTRR